MSNQVIIKNQDLAQEFVNSEEALNNLLYIINFDRFCYYQKAKGCFRIMQDREMERMVYYYLRDTTTKNLTMHITADVINQAKIICKRQYKNFSTDYIAFEDQLFNVATQQFEPFDVQKIAFSHIPLHSLDFQNLTDTPPPLLKQFLDFVIVDKELKPNPELTTLVQEMFGYCLLPTTKAEACFFLVGEGANGKSKLLDILIDLIGENYVGSQSIGALTTDKFALSTLIGKKVNICTEESSDFVKQDKFKALVSGELVTIEKKFAHGFSERLPAKFLFATNEMPSFTGFNTAFLRRIKMIPFHRTIKPEERDVNIVKKVLQEKHEIYLWAAAGMKRLLSNGMQFSQSVESEVKAKELAMGMSSSIEFVTEMYTESEGAWKSNKELYYEYKEIWCKDVGKKPVNRDRFHKEIARFLTLDAKVGRGDKGTPERGRQLVPKLEELEGESDKILDALVSAEF